MMRLSKSRRQLSWARGSSQTEALMIRIYLSSFGGYSIYAILILVDEALAILIWLLHSIAIHDDLFRVLIIEYRVI